MLKISISGLPGSGVTALLSETKKILGLKYRVETLDPIFNRNPFDNESRSGFISCFFDLTSQINEENSRSISNPHLLICNRSIMDYWIFWKHDMLQKTRSPQLIEKHELLKHLVNYWIPSYDHYYLIRRDLKLIQDALATVSSSDLSEEDMRSLETGYLEFASSREIQVNEIWNNGSMDEVAQELTASISGLIPEN